MLRFCVAAALLGLAASYPCTFSLGTDNYDASPLNTGKDYNFQVASTNFWVAICAPTVIQKCGSDAAVCQEWDPTNVNGHASLGSASTATFTAPGVPGKDGKGFTIQFTNGDAGRNVELDLICDPTIDGGMPVYGGEAPPLHYNFQWSTKYACPVTAPPPGPPGPGPSPPGPPGSPGGPGGKAGPSGGTIFLIILACGAVVYVGAGIAWNHFKVHNTGVELIPNVGFWTSIPGLVWDGLKYIWGKIRGLRGGGGYSTL